MNFDRRKLLTALSTGIAAAALAALPAQAVMPASVRGGADPGGTGASRSGEPFGTVRQIDAGALNVGYVDAGPADGPAVILLHGFPYDIHSFEKVTPLLADRGYRVIVPYLRGHGSTTFLSDKAVRSAEQSAFAVDIVALMDALKIPQATLAGFDWGSRTADIIAALWPERVRNLVSVSGYLITDRQAQENPQKPPTEHVWWYQYYFATPRGEKGLAAYRHDFGAFVWKLASPTWDFDQKTYDRTARAFDNPDWVPIIIDNYRWRLSLVDGEPAYADLEAKLAARPKIAVPTITIDADRDPFGAGGSDAAYRAQFTGPYEHRVLKGIGHDVPQEAPEAFAQAVIDVADLLRRAPAASGARRQSAASAGRPVWRSAAAPYRHSRSAASGSSACAATPPRISCDAGGASRTSSKYRPVTPSTRGEAARSTEVPAPCATSFR